MNRHRWQKIATLIAIALAVACLVLALVLISVDAGPGEVSVVLQGAAIVFSLITVAALAVVALWFWFWKIRSVRWAGFGCIAAAALWVAYNVGVQKRADWAYEREVAVATAKANQIGDRYLERLIAEQPATAYLSRVLFEEFLVEHRAVPSPSGHVVFEGREFRAVWFTYYWTFFDPDFEGFTTFYPRDSDCALFLEAFGAKYAEVAPVPAFVDLCETP